ncbi:Hypothetical protein PHPALM_6025 [Phytophthora palmivora]|uniref:PiggyBac transposable element-derived protein 4 C-terminal zinc-finger domain-containing protein n=1 Tax=Phytophthora palmivora TaxID=4796 RepID=A0A2P4YFX7_9STRA|nr:Hypothetical protein PHPALM_6025 [Phytophthora palmivora]
MGGVDVHDQLRMQRYSVQLAYKSRKYYRTLFLGLLDMALENSFIVHRYYRKVNNKSPVKHFAFMEDLMEQLLAVDSTEAFAQARSVSSAQVGHLDNEHRLEENPDTVDDSEEDGKKRHRTCKVCAFYKTKSSKFTKYFCPGCSKRDRRKYLCNVPREGRSDTCFTVWHTTWNNGNDIPAELLRGHKARERPPASRPGKKRRRAGGARELLLGGDEAGEAGNDEE